MEASFNISNSSYIPNTFQPELASTMQNHSVQPILTKETSATLPLLDSSTEEEVNATTETENGSSADSETQVKYDKESELSDFVVEPLQKRFRGLPSMKHILATIKLLQKARLAPLPEGPVPNSRGLTTRRAALKCIQLNAVVVNLKSANETSLPISRRAEKETKKRCFSPQSYSHRWSSGDFQIIRSTT
ncbi:hypothetical protein TYRP_021127 [Tyrophagus putrescentiae]|nr:hypothetical protein TYRP_021127 [Tyrophagus putrescentiae]